MNTQADLFDYAAKKDLAKAAPLAARMRPRNLSEFIGQHEAAGKNSLLRKAISDDNAGSLILWGPPGCGKTTLARIIAKESRSKFYPISAVAAGVADLRKTVAAARESRSFNGQKSILFIDEIHRFNKAQQDAILPFVESGLITLIGATTENPSFEVNSALLSRCRVYALHPHSREDMRKILKRATEDEDRGLASYRPEITEDAMELLISVSGGDARIALNSLEYAVITAPPEGEEGIRRVDADRMDKAICFRTSRYDKKGDGHYDIISAFIKSMRNSDADATVYWLARMIDSGEDPMFIARRMIIFASEDIGMADPIALNLASSALNGVKAVGMPEGRIILGHCACYLASAPKDNSAYRAINEALKDVREGKVYPVPKHLRNAVTDLMKDMGYGAGYKYAHDFPEGKADMQCLPDELKDRKYFKPKGPTCSGKQANQKQSD